MARPKQHHPTGDWSLLQIARHAGITHRTARTLQTSGYLPQQELRAHHVVHAQVAAAIATGPLPYGATRTDASDTLIRRNFKALELAQSVLNETTPSIEARLVITPSDASLATGLHELLSRLGPDASDTLLLLPVGHWARRLTELLANIPNEDRAS